MLQTLPEPDYINLLIVNIIKYFSYKFMRHLVDVAKRVILKKNHNKLIKSTESILAFHNNCKNENIVFHMKHPMFHVGLRLIQKDGLEKTMKGKKRPQKTTPERELKIYRNLPISAGPVSFCLLAHQSNICGGRFIEQVSIQYKSNSKPRSV